MAVVGIVMKFFQIVISIVVGMAAGCIPIVGFNMGAGQNTARARHCLRSCWSAEALVGAAGADALVGGASRRQLIGIFGAANESAYYTALCRAVHSGSICA